MRSDFSSNNFKPYGLLVKRKCTTLHESYVHTYILFFTNYNIITWAPRRDHYRLLRTHHRLLLRVIGYRHERGTYRQLSYAQAPKKTGCQIVEATIRQRRLLFAGAMARQPAGCLPKRLMDGKLVGGEDPGMGRPEQNWMDCLKDDFQAFGATDGSTTVDN